MKIAKVVGTTVCTVKESKMENSKLLLIRDVDQAGKELGTPYIALDTIGTGPDELVIVVEGSSARNVGEQMNKPVDAAIIGILDSLQYKGKTTFKKH